MRIFFLLLCAVFLAATSALRAQEAVTVRVLTDVRVHSPSFQGVGAAADATSSSLTLFVPEQRDPVTVPFAGIERLEVSRPHSRTAGAWRGARWGALGGAVLLTGFYLLAEVAFPDQEAFQDIHWPATATLFLVGGTGAGAAYGAYRPGSYWEPVPEPFRVQVVR